MTPSENVVNELSVESIQAISVMAELNDVEKYSEKQEKNGEGGVSMNIAWEGIKADMRELGRKEGREEGREEFIRIGIFALIADNIEIGNTKENIAKKLQKYFSLSEAEVLQYMNQYFI